MTRKEIVWKLVQMDDNKMSAIIDKAVDAYFYILLDIVNDIYDSCIEDYYNGYTPKFYDRHGNIEGFNLYSANSNDFSGGYLHIRSDANKLEPYRGGDADSILGYVEHGKRGGPGIQGWPKRWYTSYPNSYSSYHVWYSKYDTIEKIMEDFRRNAFTETTDLLWKCIERLV